MSAATTLKSYRGDDVAYVLTITQDGVAVNLTGATVKFTMRTSKTASGYVIQKTVTTHTTPLSGITTVTLSHTDTAVAATTYVYDFELTTSDGNVTTLVAGNYIIEQDVT